MTPLQVVRLVAAVVVLTALVLVGLVGAQVVADNRQPHIMRNSVNTVQHGCLGNGPPPNGLCGR
jgi:hypothetical protein